LISGKRNKAEIVTKRFLFAIGESTSTGKKTHFIGYKIKQVYEETTSRLTLEDIQINYIAGNNIYNNFI
jgi:hypothetical protein